MHAPASMRWMRGRNGSGIRSGQFAQRVRRALEFGEPLPRCTNVGGARPQRVLVVRAQRRGRSEPAVARDLRAVDAHRAVQGRDRREEPGVEALRRDVGRDPARDLDEVAAIEREPASSAASRTAARRASSAGAAPARRSASSTLPPGNTQMPGWPSRALRWSSRSSSSGRRAAGRRCRTGGGRSRGIVGRGGRGAADQAHPASPLATSGLPRYFSTSARRFLMPEFVYQPILEHGHDETAYRRLDGPSLKVRVAQHGSRRVLEVDPEALRELASVALDDVSHLCARATSRSCARSSTTRGVANDRFVALELLKNANIAAGACCRAVRTPAPRSSSGYKAPRTCTTGADERAALLSHGIYDTYQLRHLRYSQMAPVGTSTPRRTTGTTMPAQVEI
jgi:hypothetical protein